MRFSAVLAVLPFVGAAVAQTAWPVQVGANGTVTFSPTTVTAAENDTIVFTFVGGNHTATQSTFANPCTPLNDPSAWNSGFEPALTPTPNPPTFNVTVANASTPMWFFCEQFIPFPHCQAGMVFAVNPTADHSYAAFSAAAKAAPVTGSGSNSSSSPAPGPTSGASSGSSSPTSGAPGPTSGGGSSGSSGAPAPSTSSNTTSAATALHAGAAGMLLGGISLLALVL